ncbi:hypothetical protein DXG01_003113 [Tephrocybe rancida]|nr:hypothetical protein DXG01_003113 [Tephrocybe rancida]
MQTFSSSVAKARPNQNGETLVVVFVHGFKGDDQSFGDFPERLQHILAESTTDIAVECVVFPAYEAYRELNNAQTKGNLNEAVIRFADWLTTLTVEREVASGGGAGKANLVLCGHRYVLYLGIHPHVFKNSVTKATEYASAAQTVGSAVFGAFAGLGAKKATTSTPQPTPAQSGSDWSSWAAPAAYAVGGALLAGAAAGSAYYKREDIGSSFNWATDHMKYVGNLWDEAALSKRVESMMAMKEQAGVTFHTFYTLIPATPPFSAARMFVVLPKRASPQYAYFSPANNTKALDEIQAHTGMFGAKTNDGYYELGLATAKIIRDSLQRGRTVSTTRPEEVENPWS